MHGRQDNEHTVAAILVIAGRPRHARGREGGPQDPVQGVAHELPVTVGPLRIPETYDVGEHDRAVQLLASRAGPLGSAGRGGGPGPTPFRIGLAFGLAGLNLSGGPPRGLAAPPGEPRRVADRREPVDVDHGQPPGPLVAVDDPELTPGLQEPAHHIGGRADPVREFRLRHRQRERGRRRVLMTAAAPGQFEQQPGQALLGAAPLARGKPHPALPRALRDLALQHLDGARMPAQEFGESLGGHDHGRHLIQRGHGGRPDLGGQRGPFPDHVTLAPHGEDPLPALAPGPDADLDPPRVDDHHLRGCIALAAQDRSRPEYLFRPRRRERLPLGVGQRIPETPRGRMLPPHVPGQDRNAFDLIGWVPVRGTGARLGIVSAHDPSPTSQQS